MHLRHGTTLLSTQLPFQTCSRNDDEELCFLKKIGFMYSRVHISSDTAFLKILKKPSIVQNLGKEAVRTFMHTTVHSQS